MKKKGISPLIATVLLIGFAVALAAVVMTWGSGFIRSTTESTEKQAETTLLCATKLSFDIKVTCPDKITIDNKCDLNIKSVTLKINEDGDITKDDTTFADGIEAYDVVTKDKSLGGINKIEAIATLEDGTTCGDSPREVNVNCAT